MAISVYSPPSERLIHNTSVDFSGRLKLSSPVHLMQYDKSLPILAVQLYLDAQPYTLPAEANINIRVGKRDGTTVYNPALGCDASRNIAYFEVTGQMCSEYGSTFAILELMIENNVAGSSYILLDIAKNPVQDDAIESSDEYQTITQIVAEATTALNKVPIVQNGTWWMWDTDAGAYTDSGISAKGEKGDTGNGIQSTVLNADYTLTIKFTDGTSYTTPKIRGEKGDKGNTGIGIASTTLNDDYTLTIRLTDGTSYTTPSIRGAVGPKGETGKGLTILGYYASEAALSAAVTNPEAGDAYGVGASTPYDIYMWDGTKNKWVNNGSLQGVKGDNGVTFTPAVSDDGVLSWTNDGGLSNPEPVNIKGKDGNDAAADKTLGLTQATVGQIAKITAVDSEGRPTEWESVDTDSFGTGDMLQETYDPDGTVAGGGGIVQYVTGEVTPLWNSMLRTDNYDPYLIVQNHGGIVGFVDTLGRDINTPVGTIRTTVRTDWNQPYWMECDGSTIGCRTYPDLWQMLYCHQSNPPLPSSSAMEFDNTVAAKMTYTTVTDPEYIYGVSSEYRYYMAVSGMYEGDAILRLYGARDLDETYVLLNSFTVASQTAMEYPCAIAGHRNGGIAVAWTVLDTVKLYYTADLETWTEAEIATEPSMCGHKIDMCEGAAAAWAWAICDCTNGTVYATQTPGDGSSWKKAPVPDECQGFEIIKARMGADGQVLRVANTSDDDNFTEFMHWLHSNGDDIYWTLYCKRGIGGSTINWLYSRPFYASSRVYYALVAGGDGNRRYIFMEWMSGGGLNGSFRVDYDLGTGCNCTDVLAYVDEDTYSVACTYTDADSNVKGKVYVSMSPDVGFFEIENPYEDIIPLALYSAAGRVSILKNNWVFSHYDYSNIDVALPNISLSDDTVTLIKCQSEEYGH